MTATPSPAPQPADGEREVDPWATEPADWTREQAEAAQAELDALELTDPAVRAAAESYDRMVKRVTRRKPTTPASADGERCECGRPLRASQYQEVESGLCLWCLNGGPPNAPTTPASAEPTEAERMTAIVQAADHLSFMVTSYLLGDLDAATVQRALEAYSAARTQEVPF